jgi:hypothetical protein
MITPEELLRRAEAYAQNLGLHIERQLGFGVQRTVYSSDRRTAIKVHEREDAYRRERDAYLRLREHSVRSILEFAAPDLISFDDNLLILEITIVSPPFVLDFGGAYLDGKPEFPPGTLAEWEADKREQFGNDWPAARQVIAALERFGVYLVDVNPGNIRLRNE